MSAPSRIGHGRLGLAAPLRPFAEFIDESSSEKVVLVEMRGGKQVESWSSLSGSAYVAAFGYLFNGVLMDVVGVRTGRDTGPGLRRVDTSAQCIAQAGTFYYDPNPPRETSGTWDDGGNWDDGGIWDDVLVLQVHLEDNSDPNGTPVLAELGYYVSTRGADHPTLSEDRLVVGGFETWASGTPTGWSKTETVWTVSQDLVDVRAGLSSLKVAGPGSGSASVYKDTLPLLSGARYRLCGEYKTEQGAAASFALTDSGGDANPVLADGRTYGSTGDAVALPDTAGEWRRFAFDFVVRGDSYAGDARLRLKGSGSAGAVHFDKVELKRIWRFVPFEARLAGSSIPSAETGSNDIFFGGKRIGTGSLSLINSDGRMEKLFGQLDWAGREIRTYFGGEFLDGQEILFDDYRRGFTGLVQNVSAVDDKVTVQLQDARVLFNVTLPPRVYDDLEFPTMDFTKVGASRPLWFGTKRNISPVRVSKTGNGYGVYELADVQKAPNGIKSVDAAYLYETQDAADLKDAAKRIQSAWKRSAAGTWTTSGVTQSGQNVIKTTATSAWDSGAYNDQTISGTEDGYVEATVGRTGAFRFALGLTADNPGWTRDTLDFAIDTGATIGTDVYLVYENGVLVFTSTRVSQQFDRLRIWNKSGVVSYYVNGTLLFTSGATPGATLFLRLAFFHQNALAGAAGVYRKVTSYHTADLALARVTVDADFNPRRVEGDKTKLDFNDGGALAATVQPGIYAPDELAFQAGGAMAGAKAAVGYFGAYSQSTHLVTLTTPSGVTLQVGTGTNKNQLYTALGFTGADRAAGTSHAGNVALFSDADKQHNLFRVDGSGFKDDASGTYTGTASAPIEVGADVLRVLATKYMPPVSIDETSFLFARGRAPEALGIYLKAPTSTKTILDTLEFSNIANIVLDGEGRLFYLVYVGDVPAGITDLFDRDFISFDADAGITDVYASVKVNFDQDPTTGGFTARGSTNPATSLRFARPDLREFQTYLVNDNNAIAYVTRMLALASAPARKVTIESRGKLVDRKVGDKIRITRSRALDAEGRLIGRVVRIISLANSYQEGKSKAECVDDVVTVAGYSCVNECQSSCEASCQTGCENTCQSTCEATCQGGCQTGCQGACQAGACQAACQLSCQGACESACQVGCQTGCQTACESACQSACQSSCQFTCQVNCQGTCELSCQTACQTTCQTACQTSCQDLCQTSCQTACQVDCQTAKQQTEGPPPI